MIYSFWDLMNNESLGLLELDEEPETGDIVIYGFIRCKPDTEWQVLAYDGTYVYAVLKSCKKFYDTGGALKYIGKI